MLSEDSSPTYSICSHEKFSLELFSNYVKSSVKYTSHKMCLRCTCFKITIKY
jgi:hypothetical protein